MTNTKNKTSKLYGPAYIAENNFGDYIIVFTRILRQIYQFILDNNSSHISQGRLVFELVQGQTWRQILKIPPERKALARMLIQDTDIGSLLVNGRPANIHSTVAQQALHKLINLFDLSRDELSALRGQAISSAEGDITYVLNRAIIPIVEGLHDFFDYLDARFQGFNIEGLGDATSLGSARISLSADPKTVFKKTKRFGMRLKIDQIEFPEINLSDRNWDIPPIPIGGVKLNILLGLTPLDETTIARGFDHDVLEGRAANITLGLNPREAFAMPYDISDVPRIGGARRQVQDMIVAAIEPLLNDGLVSIADALGNSLSRNLVSFFGLETYNLVEFTNRVRLVKPSQKNANLVLRYPPIATRWKNGKLRVESLTPQMGHDTHFDRGHIGGITDYGGSFEPAPRPFSSIDAAQDDVLNLWSTRKPDWPKFELDRKMPGRVRLATNAVAPTQFVRHLIRDANIVKDIKVSDNFTATLKEIGDIALDFQGPVTPSKDFENKPALLIRNITTQFDINGIKTDIAFSCRIRLRPVMLSQGPVNSAEPNISEQLRDLYQDELDYNLLIEHVHFRNFIFLHQSYLPVEVEISPSSVISTNITQSDVVKFCKAWARALPAIPLMLDPWFLVHPNSAALLSSKQSHMQGVVLPEIKVDPLGILEGFERKALSNGMIRLFDEWIVDTQPIDPTQNLVTAFRNVHVRNGWIVMDRMQSFLDILKFSSMNFGV